MNKTDLTAKLFCIVREFQKQIDIETATTEEMLNWCRDQIKRRFDLSFYKNIDAAASQLALFLLGNKDNQFDRLIQ